MDEKRYEVESFQTFSESLIWQLNRDYYQKNGVEAWSKGIVPHNITSNSFVGRTYAELILGFLQDLAAKGAVEETVYIIELGAGHGRLGYHVLRHLENLTALLDMDLPPYCYVLTDIAEENLKFFKDHPQLQPYYERGVLDYAYYDAIDGKSITLRQIDHTINKGDLNQPIVALGNYFFDSIPNDLFHIQENKISSCSIALHSTLDPTAFRTDLLLKDLEFTFKSERFEKPYYDSEILNTLLEDYQSNLSDTYLFFPERSIQCLQNLRALSPQGLMLLSMDKGFHRLDKLDKKEKPEIITHGSFSIWVNYHALGSYCERVGGKVLFPSYSTFHLQVACLLCVEKSSDYTITNSVYQHSVNNFGPDDYDSIKKLSYEHSSSLSLMHLIALLRLSAYDSTFFITILPRLKELVKKISHVDRDRIAETLDFVWGYYFNINESVDLALNIAGIFFDLGFYDKALVYYQYSTDVYGIEMDTLYNKTLCYYQLRQDVLFTKSLKDAKERFPDTGFFDALQLLDMTAE